ncbi:hypothetical protein CFOL_v3_25710, partial [Cephalotus follicularis]
RQICGKTRHGALKCWRRFDTSFQAYDIPQALVVMHMGDSQDKVWFLDTSANAHMTNMPGNLGTIVPYTRTNTVMVGSRENLPIAHIACHTPTFDSVKTSI